MTERKVWDEEAANLEAEAAADELDGIALQFPDAVMAIAGWWESHYKVSGHKRLGRIIVQRRIKK